MSALEEPTLSEGLATTRSIRRYTDEPVTEEQLSRTLFLATRAPSGSNRQPTRFVVLRQGPVALEVRRLLAEGAAEIWSAKRSSDEFPDRAAATPTDRMLATMDTYVDRLAEAPVIVLPCMVRYRDPVQTEGGSVYPAVQNLLLGARAVGLGGALTMFHHVREDEIRAALGIPNEAFIAATVTLGHPAGSHGPVRRKPLDRVVFEDRWDNAASWAVDPEGTRFTGGPNAD
ncbi:MAG: nitroreductase family protein [Actinomycetota bacterium]